MTLPLLNFLFTEAPQELAYDTRFYSNNTALAPWSSTA